MSLDLQVTLTIHIALSVVGVLAFSTFFGMMVKLNLKTMMKHFIYVVGVALVWRTVIAPTYEVMVV